MQPQIKEDVPADLVSTTEAALAAGVSAVTIRNWIRSGLIGAFRRGKVYRVSLSAVKGAALRPYEPGPRKPKAGPSERTERQRAAAHRRAMEHLESRGVKVEG
jgi:excisionase family DNA binding protein